MKNVYLAASVRTPIGRFGGTLASWTAADLGVAAARASLERAHLHPDQVQQSIWGCARQAGGGPNVARQITYRAGVPETVPAFTVNQACGSGLQAIILAAQQIISGELGQAELLRELETLSAIWRGDAPKWCLPAARRVCRACPILLKARAGACAWETPNSWTACTAMASTIHSRDW